MPIRSLRAIDLMSVSEMHDALQLMGWEWVMSSLRSTHLLSIRRPDALGMMFEGFTEREAFVQAVFVAECIRFAEDHNEP